MFYGTSEYVGFKSYVFMDEKVREIRLPQKRKLAPKMKRKRLADALARKVNEWVFEGKLFSCDYDLWGTPFQRKVCDIVRRIPLGLVMTYSGVARKAGSNAPRAVGNTMARNPLPLLIPCHRVIAQDLTLNDFGGGVWMKRKLLEYEGVEFSGEKVLRGCVLRVR
jgi:O-6-methylguanine DNA methyltransferase